MKKYLVEQWGSPGQRNSSMSYTRKGLLRYERKNVRANAPLFFRSFTVLIGTIIGAGIFGVPYVVSQVGIVWGAALLGVVGIIAVLVHLMLGEVVLRTPSKHRMVGYAEIYLGPNWKKIVALTSVVGMYGGLLAYIILGGDLLYLLFPLNQPDAMWHVLGFYGVFVFAVLKGTKVVSWIEFVASFLLVLFVVGLFATALPSVEFLNLQPATSLGFSSIFIPYGVMLFSLMGTAAVPEVRQVLEGKLSKRTKRVSGRAFVRALSWGTFVPGVLTFLFAFAVVGLLGSSTTSDSLSNLAPILGSQMVLFGGIFGVAAVFTSMIVTGTTLKKIFWYDYSTSHTTAWILVISIPLMAYFLGLRDFIGVIALMGGVLGGIEGMLLIKIHRSAQKKGKRKPEYKIIIPAIVRYVLLGMFILGMIYQLFFVRF